MVRVGEAARGAVMCADAVQEKVGGVAFSIGAGGADAWGLEVSAARSGPVHQFDCVNTTAPPCPPHDSCDAHFHQACLGPASGLQYEDGELYHVISLADMVRTYAPAAREVVLKLDCAGCEWEALVAATAETLRSFSVLVVEFHLQGLDRDSRQEKYLAAMERLLESFVLVHAHGSNALGFVKLRGTELHVPKVVETTWVRKDLVDSTPCVDARYLPGLDHPVRHEQGWPEIYGSGFALTPRD